MWRNGWGGFSIIHAHVAASGVTGGHWFGATRGGAQGSLLVDPRGASMVSGLEPRSAVGKASACLLCRFSGPRGCSVIFFSLKRGPQV